MATYTENEYRGVSLKMDDVFIPPHKAKPTPSELDNLDAESENKLRVLGCESIQDAGKLLKLPQVAVACAQVLYHRFYFSKSFVRHNWEHYAMACVFLSAKIEESCRRLRDVVTVFVHLRQFREQSVFKPFPIPEYAELKPHIIKAERRILKELGFCVHGKHPHKLICLCLHVLGQTDNIELAQLSWNYMNDSLRTTVFACYHPETIACACIFLASRHLQCHLGTNCFEIFNVSEDTLETISLSILKLYSLKKQDVTELEKKVAQLRKAQIEARNQKIAQEKKEQQDSNNLNSFTVESKSKKSDRDIEDKRDVDTKGKENLEKSSSHRKKNHKSRKSPSMSPRYERRYRSRSPKKGRDHSQEKRKSHKKYTDKRGEYVDKKYRKSYDSEDEYNSDKRRRGHGEYNGSKEYFKQKLGSPNSSNSEKRNSKKRQRSSSPSNNDNGSKYLHKTAAVAAAPPVSSSSKHSSRHIQNGTKLYR